MWVNGRDIKAGLAELSHMVGRNGTEVPKTAKYPIDHKMFHHGAAVSGLAAIVTGIYMMLRLETPFWAANPYLLSESSWGIMYIVHGVSGVALITLVITHIYFAIRPDKWWITKSMIYGFIGQDKYVENFDPALWPVPGVGAAPQEEELVPAGVGASVSAGESATPESAAPESAAPESAAPESAAPEPAAPEPGDSDSGAPGDSGESSSDDRASEVGGLD